MSAHIDKFPDAPVVNNLKKIRKSKGITQQQLADLIGVDRMTINKIENSKTGVSSAYTCLLIAKVLGVGIGEISSLSEAIK